MRRDSLIYAVFQQAPDLLFELIEALSPAQLEALLEGLLGFTNQKELYDWLKTHLS